MAEFRRSGSFTLSPRKRTSFGGIGPLITPSVRRQSLSMIATPKSYDLIDGSKNNDEAEKRERMLSRLQQLNVRASSSPSGTPIDRRKSLSTVAGLTNQQLTDHYAKCIQLSAENKINVKNAFDLQLIDYMAEMLKRKDSDMNNFQVASCTLDASTKIYAYRVDSIHTDTIKIAGGLGRTKEKDPNAPDIEDLDGGIDGKVKRKIRSKKYSSIETNLKNLDVVHFDLEFDVDPLFKKIATQFDEGRTGGGQFLSSLYMHDDSCQLILDSETVLSNLCQDFHISQPQLVSIPIFPDMNKYISPTFSTFEFTKWNLRDEDEFNEISKIHDEPEKLLGSEKHAFDINAIPEPLDDHDNYEPEGIDDVEGDDGSIFNDGTVITIGKAACGPALRPPPPQLEVMHLKDHLSNVPLEYSYFDTRVMSAWAGPGHWKLKPLVKDKMSYAKKPGKKKNVIYLEYTVIEDELDEHFCVNRKPTKLSRNTIKNWNKSQTTLPVDLHYDPKKFSLLYLRLDVLIRRRQGKEISGTEVDDSIGGYDYDNQNDKENYCAEIDTGSNYGDNVAQDFEETTIFSQTVLQSRHVDDDITMDFLGTNLVEAPNKVAKIHIGYARTAKKIDMKKLKSTVWYMLSGSAENKENERYMDTEVVCEKMESSSTLSFSNLYKELPLRLPTKMAENISVSLAFIALLHLANEHNLNLHTTELLGDFCISQG